MSVPQLAAYRSWQTAYLFSRSRLKHLNFPVFVQILPSQHDLAQNVAGKANPCSNSTFSTYEKTCKEAMFFFPCISATCLLIFSDKSLHLCALQILAGTKCMLISFLLPSFTYRQTPQASCQCLILDLHEKSCPSHPPMVPTVIKRFEISSPNTSLLPCANKVSTEYPSDPQWTPSKKRSPSAR